MRGKLTKMERSFGQDEDQIYLKVNYNLQQLTKSFINLFLTQILDHVEELKKNNFYSNIEFKVETKESVGYM